MKNRELYTLRQGLQQAIEITASANLAVATARNSRLVNQEIEDIETAQKASEEYNEYEKAMFVVVNKYAQRDVNGNVIQNGSNIPIVRDKVEQFQEVCKILEDEHADALESRREQIKQFNELLDQECDIALRKIDASDIPESAVSGKLLLQLDAMIK